MRTLKRWIVKHILRDWPTKKVHALVEQATASRRCLGLFDGMQYVSRSIGSEYYPKILGTYEKELIPVFEDLLRKPFETFIDIGAAEGYYAVGMALKTDWNIIAFEADPTTPLPELAELNQLESRIDLRIACDLGDLQDCLVEFPKALLLVDVETAEFSLLDPRFIPELRTTTIIVEVHDCFLHGIGERLKNRFASTHTIERIDAQKRTPEDFPLIFPKLPFDPRLYTLKYLDEARPNGMYWLILNPSSNTKLGT